MIGGGSFLASGYYASFLAIACSPRQEKGELCGEGADHVVPGPHAARAHNTMLCQQLSPCLSGSPAHFTSLTVDENILSFSSSTGCSWQIFKRCHLVSLVMANVEVASMATSTTFLIVITPSLPLAT